MRPKIIALIEMCLEAGIRRGYSRAYKYNESPTEEDIVSSIHDCVMHELYEWFDF